LYSNFQPKQEEPQTKPPTVAEPQPYKRIKLSSDNLLSHEVLNSSVTSNVAAGGSANNNNNLSHTDSPHNARQQFQHKQENHYVNVSPFHHHNQSGNTAAAANVSGHRKPSSNNLLSNEYDSPMVGSTGAAHPHNHGLITMSASASINCRLSTDRILNASTKNNMSNNNLSTSASLLDATNDDAMSIDSPFESKQRNNDSSHGILSSASSNGATKKVNKRSARIYELFETEKRFVNILHTIIQVNSLFHTRNKTINYQLIITNKNFKVFQRADRSARSSGRSYFGSNRMQGDLWQSATHLRSTHKNQGPFGSFG
jgi:hypothetical protein